MNWLNLASRYSYRQDYYHAMLLDPPYHLTSITKRFSTGKAAKYGTDGAFQRASKGFMGQTWDGGDLAFNPELWAALKDMLLPGAFCFAFAGSRGWHRMAVAIEDAGFIMHPTLFLWAYGSGFPKATRIDTQIDKAAGKEREVVETRKQTQGPESMTRRKTQSAQGYRPEGKEFGQLANDTFTITAPATPLAKQWEGHRYGLQAIKPAVEPILCFQKPYKGRPIDSITTTGAGALNIDGGRISTNELTPRNNKNTKSLLRKGFEGKPKVIEPDRLGRWPSNLLLQHHPDCKKVGEKRVKGITGGKNPHKKPANIFAEENNRTYFDHADPDGTETIDDWQCVDDCPVKKLGEQSGESASNIRPPIPDNPKDIRGTWQMHPRINADGRGHNDSGTAARFFYQSHFAYEIHEQIATADPVRYVAKAGKKERNVGLDRLPNQLRHRMRPDKNKLTGLNKEPRWSPVEAKNFHPTVKPTALTKYLASLLLPPEAYEPRRILVPFAGSGSEMIGALLAGWDEVTGIEMTKKYIPIAKARLDWWSHYLKWDQADIDTVLNAAREDDGQLSFIEELE